jgi:pyrroline-5-carboxylate reductase
MNLGFVGTGEITAAIVTGLCSASNHDLSIRLSPRNHVIAKRLAERFAVVSIASSNQEVLDLSDVVVIAVRPSVSSSVLAELHFRPEHCIISVVSGLSSRRLSELIAPAIRIVRAVPLPSTARRNGPTGIYPPDALAQNLFSSIGTVFPVDTEHEFEAMCATTATIASIYALMERVASWLAKNGVRDRIAREYVARVFCGLSCAVAESPDESFEFFVKAHATAGGTNEQFLKHIGDSGLLEGIPDGLTAVLKRISRT